MHGVRRRAPQGVRVLLAQHGQRQSLSSGLSARQPTSVSGSVRVGFRLFRRRVSCFALRQSEERRKEKLCAAHQREETARFIGFRSHWGFAVEFCTPGEGHEKGGVEGAGASSGRTICAGAKRAELGGVKPAAGGG